MTEAGSDRRTVPLGSLCACRSGQALACVLVLAAATTAADVTVGARVGRGDYSGSLQTPTGGQPGTASPARPTFSELRLDDGPVYGFDVRGDIGDIYALEFSMYRARQDSTSVLATPLMFNGAMFDAGETIASEFGFNGYDVSAIAEFAAGSRTLIEVGMTYARTAFEIEIEGASQRRRRGYHINALGVLVRAEHRLNDRVEVGMDTLLAPSYSNFHEWYRIEPFVGYAIDDRWEVRLLVTLDWIDYDDAHKQTLPNHLDFERVTASAELRYSW